MGRQAGWFVLVGVLAAVIAGPAAGRTPPSISSGLDVATGVRCEGTQPRTIITSGQSCTIVQPAGGTAWCIQRTKKQRAVAVTQRCEIRQAGTWRENIAYVVQVIDVKGKASAQDATQIADIRQGNEFADNRASVTQVTKLSLNRKGKGRDDNGGNAVARGVVAQQVEQAQEAHQSVIVCQGAAGAQGPVDPTNCRSGNGMRADNVATVAQTQSESERASKAGRIVQEQNTARRPNACSPSDVSDPVVPDEDANACANVDQSTQLSPPAAGDNRSRLSQLYIQSQEASRAEWTAQCQGFPAAPCFLSGSPEVGGLDYTINQSGPDPSTIATEQRSLQVQRIDGIATFIRKQDPRISKGAGSTQGTHPNNRWTGSQIATQLQFEDGRLRSDSQSALLEYFGRTSGRIRATQAINQNGRKAKNSCSGSICAAVLECTTPPPESQARVRRISAISHPQTCAAPDPDDDDDED